MKYDLMPFRLEYLDHPQGGMVSVELRIHYVYKPGPPPSWDYIYAEIEAAKNGKQIWNRIKNDEWLAHRCRDFMAHCAEQANSFSADSQREVLLDREPDAPWHMGGE